MKKIYKLNFSTMVILSFIAGIIFWQLSIAIKRNSVLSQISKSEPSETNKFYSRPLVLINDTPIYLKDLEWEYQLITMNITEDNELTPKSNVAADFSVNFLELKQQLLSEVIERKVLYAYLKNDSKFDSTNKKRYVACYSQFENLEKTNPELVKTKHARETLKSRICETSLIKQYAEETLKTKIKLSETDLREYYKNNQEEFNHKSRVFVRQIVLATEAEAKKVLPTLTRENFRDMAQKHSISPEYGVDGVYGPIERGQFGGIFDVAFSMRTGEIRGVLRSAYGFQILLLVDKKPSGLQSFEDARGNIAKILHQKVFDQYYEKLIESALAAATIKSEEKIW